MPTRFWIAFLAVAAATLALAPAPARAQAGARAGDPVEKLMADFIHYVRIDRPDLASDIGRLILDRDLTEREFAAMIEDADRFSLSDFEDVLGKGLKYPDVEPVIAEMDRLYLEGKKAQARDPREISRNINLLVGNLRARRLARQRLIAASEYAMPQLLKAYLEEGDQRLRGQVETVMIDMGRGAVTPLCTALPNLPPAHQQSVVKVLGIIGYDTALPYIAELLAQEGIVDDLQSACERAIARIGREDRALDPAARFFDLAEGYYDQRSELTVFPGETHQLLWRFDPGIGLLFTPIRTPVYHEAMAMRLARRSMSHDPDDSADPVALWTAANLRREIEAPEGYDNPAYPADRRSAEYYAVLFGPGTCQAVLARAIGDDNTPLARRAIGALAKTAGGPALWTGAGDRPAPLLAALQYPDRRTQYEAALVLGAAQPQTEFPGSDRVVPTLAAAVRDAGDQYALIVTPDRETYNELRGLVSGLGYDPLPYAPSLADAAEPLADAPGVDLLLIARSTIEGIESTLDHARNAPKLAVAPTLILASPQAAIDLAKAHRNNRLVAVRQRGVSTDMMRTSLNDLVQRAAGGQITTGEARDYTARALDVLRDLAITDNPVLNPADAVRPLLTALADAQGQTQLRIARVLSRIPQSRAQVAIMEAALDASADHRARLLDIVAASARRYGNMLQQRHVDQLMQLARATDAGEATSAAALIGSLNLPDRDLVPVILEHAQLDDARDERAARR